MIKKQLSKALINFPSGNSLDFLNYRNDIIILA